MKKFILAALALLLILVFIPEITKGHGGRYRAPSDVVPPNLGTPPPGSTTGGNTPGPAQPTTGGGRLTAPSCPVTPRTKGGDSFTRKPGRGSSGTERWEFWWENNKDDYLNLRLNDHRFNPGTGSAGFLTGRGRKEKAIRSTRPSPPLIRRLALPALTAALEETHPDILDSSVLALARILDKNEGGKYLNRMVDLLADKHPSVRQSATLALGVLGDPRAESTLYDLATDSVAGRRLVGGEKVSDWVRAFAALSLGYVDTPSSAERLLTLARRTPDRDYDLKGCAVTALGLIETEGTREKITACLCDTLVDEKTHRLIRAAAAEALGRLGNPAAVSTVLEVLRSDRTDRWVRASSVIALGRLAELDHPEAVKRLMTLITKGKDRFSIDLAYIALGQMSARAAQREIAVEVQTKVARLFRNALKGSGSNTRRPWAALGAAIQARSAEAFKGALATRLEDAFEDESNPSCLGAYAIALGLIDAQAQRKTIANAFEKSKDPALRGYLAVALGMLKHRGSVEAIREVVSNPGTSPTLRLQAATSLGLMGDPQAVGLLVETLAKYETLSVASSVVSALGLIGDRSAVEPLARILSDPKRGDLTRAFAAVALGLLGEKTDLPWNVPITRNGNYHARVPALKEVADIL